MAKAPLFQNGYAAYEFVRGHCALAVDALKLRDMNMEWDALDLLADVGVSVNSILDMQKKINNLSSKRPTAKTRSEKAEKLLELIWTCSKHFSESALTEFNAPAGERRWEHPGGHAHAGQRDYVALAAHFHTLWKAAVDNRLPGFAKRAPTPKAPVGSRQTLESGLVMGESRDQLLLAGSNDYIVPPTGSPTPSLALLASAGRAGHDLAGRHGLTTTTDYTQLEQYELCAAADDGGLAGEFEVAALFDADNTGSVEIICDNCKGLGHIKRVCASNKNRSRSFEYAIAAPV